MAKKWGQEEVGGIFLDYPAPCIRHPVWPPRSLGSGTCPTAPCTTLAACHSPLCTLWGF